jgi:hypothetical protein
MLILRDSAAVSGVADPAIAKLLALRFEQISQDEPYDPDVHGFFILVEPSDTVSALEAASGCWITQGLFSDARYGEPDFCPCFEVLEEHPCCWEMVFVLNDGGFGVLFAIPKTGIDDELLRFCRRYAVPAPPLAAVTEAGN